MMYLHFCPSCKRIHILNGHRVLCPACDNKLTELNIPYMEYIKMNTEKRESLLISCLDQNTLSTLGITYRMHKYAGRYRKNSKELETSDSC